LHLQEGALLGAQTKGGGGLRVHGGVDLAPSPGLGQTAHQEVPLLREELLEARPQRVRYVGLLLGHVAHEAAPAAGLRDENLLELLEEAPRTSERRDPATEEGAAKRLSHPPRVVLDHC